MSLMTFLVFQILPGDPASIILGPNADPVQLENLRKELNTDEPLTKRYTHWVKEALTGDLGISIRYHQPVSTLIASRIPVTASLAGISVLLTLVIGVPLGTYLAKADGKIIETIVSMITQLGTAIPSFWMGILLIMLFAVTLGLLPAGGYIALKDNPAKWLGSLLLPSLSIALGTSAVLIRYLKTSLLEEKNKLYVQTARSRGFSERTILYKHILRNALIPTVTILGMLVVDILGGSIITENVFNIPGLGNLIVSSINSRDFPLIQGLVLYLASIVVIFNFLVDILYALVDPRLRIR